MALERDAAAKTVITLNLEATPHGMCDSDSANGAGWVNHGVESRGPVGEAQLWARIEQQSTLIAMLKERNDETLKELHQCRQSHSDMSRQKEELQQMLKEERKTSAQLHQRFQILSRNHDKMTEIKDDYKSSNAILRQENERLRKESAGRTPEVLQEREREIRLLNEEGREREERERVTKERCEILQREVVSVLQQMQERDELNSEQLEREKRLLQASEERCSEVEACLARTKKELDDLHKEKKQLLLSSQEREITITAKESQLSQLRSDVRELSGARSKLTEELERLSIELSHDVQVQRLRDQLKQTQISLEKLQRELSTYKTHSAIQLQRERELNSKLRHMADL